MTAKNTVLVCDHSGNGLLEALRPLEAMGYALESSTSLGNTRKLIRSLRPALVVIEPLSRSSSVELELLAAARAGSTLPVLVVAEADNPVPLVQGTRALDTGPWDLIYRSAPPEEFLMRVQRLQRLAEGINELAEMRYAAAHADRTSLLRPVHFNRRLQEHFAAAQRHQFELALALLDLDDFGRVNKEFDHTVGDAVIDRVGSVVRDNLRTEDVGGRLGGDEFAILLPYTSRTDTARVVARLRDQVHGLSGSIEAGGRELRVSTSIGFETFSGSDLESVELLRRRAELALREAKRLGGNRGVYYRQLQKSPDTQPES